MAFRSGYVAIVGRPNVGKSTLMNAILGERLSIVTEKPQTTRHRIAGILTEADFQMIFLDTPGYHRSVKPLNRVMNDIVDAVTRDADVVCLLVAAGDREWDIERGLFDRIGAKRCVVVVNKSDLITRNKFDAIAAKFRDEWGVKELAIISALKGDGVRTLIEAMRERLPEGDALYPDDIYTDRPVRFLAAELIREQVFLQMRQEIPYSAAVEIEEFKDPTEGDSITRIRAAIIVEKESQKAMIIGRGGSRIKEIGKRSRLKIEDLVGGKVYLELFVRVESDWTKDRDLIRRLGYTDQMD